MFFVFSPVHVGVFLLLGIFLPNAGFKTGLKVACLPLLKWREGRFLNVDHHAHTM